MSTDYIHGLSIESIKATLDLIFQTQEHTPRITDIIDVSGDAIIRKTKRELVIPMHGVDSLDQLGKVFVPVFRGSKDRMFGDLAVVNESCEELPRLNHSEHAEFTDVLFQSKMRLFVTDPLFEDFVQETCALITSGTNQQALDCYRDVFLAPTLAPPVSQLSISDFRALRDMAFSFASTKFVFAVIEPSMTARRIIEVRSYFSYDAAGASNWDAFKRRCGQRPSEFSFPLDLAGECQSFHQVIKLPRKHLASEGFVEERMTIHSDEKVLGDMPIGVFEPLETESVSWVQEKGSEFVELICINIDAQRAKRIAANYVLCEITPGPTLLAVFVLAIVTFLFAINAIFIHALVQHWTPAMPEIVIGLPGVLILIGQFGRSDGRIVSAPLLVIFSWFYAGIMCVLGAVGYIVIAAISGTKNPSLRNYQIAWAGLSLLLGILLILVIVRAFKTARINKNAMVY